MIRDLATLLARASPRLHPRAIAVVGLEGFALPPALPADAVIASLREAEGLTLYVDLAAAQAAGLPVAFRAAWITMTVESALDAVGFTAAFAGALARAGIACNVLAGARHDHLFVPWAQAEAAMRILRALQDPGQDPG
ncbi:MAG TPA: ACT domain-containing protein [Roseiarcus sp.]|nr:ACT domain-containing protein [Roseiarcus sp.]